MADRARYLPVDVDPEAIHMLDGIIKTERASGQIVPEISFPGGKVRRVVFCSWKNPSCDRESVEGEQYCPRHLGLAPKIRVTDDLSRRDAQEKAVRDREAEEPRRIGTMVAKPSLPYTENVWDDEDCR